MLTEGGFRITWSNPQATGVLDSRLRGNDGLVAENHLNCNAAAVRIKEGVPMKWDIPTGPITYEEYLQSPEIKQRVEIVDGMVTVVSYTSHMGIRVS